ncbi:prolyl oligopeptidase family serine peptidase [Altererythrobacter aerius]|uniref:Prolyl oligopeptidase family serine peptidase n=1 Tax=Tsuneonella aeria TaxID=1837929 RepID=A0A6I4TIE5_9SPHN|nr:prolyl oligopeptidase family serine peptidase [Tsuneonella aeria]MXO75820.1 prolyl oligopeptidase family serine peptidase [Tsuneonella aeria]
MKHVLTAAALASLAACTATPPPASAPPAAEAPAADDPYLALEDIHGAAALAKVEEWNARTMAALSADPRFEKDRAEARAILDDKSQIARPGQVFGDMVTNLWRDADHPRGIWRQATLASFNAGKPQWQTLIDVDALGKAEEQSWVWHGANCLAPDYNRCLVSLSPGGTDADVVREWDRRTRSFVEGGFTIPLAKSDASWLDADTLLVGTDWGPGAMTDSGYPRIVKRWTRGTPLAAATTIKEGAAGDIAVRGFSILDGDTRHAFVSQGTSFYASDTWLLRDDGSLVRTPVPDTADIQGVIGGRLIAYLNKPMDAFPAGAVVSWPIAEALAGRNPAPSLVFAPTGRQAVQSVATTDNAIWVALLDDVAGKIVTLRPSAAGWSARTAALPANATLEMVSSDDARDTAYVIAQGFTLPPTLYAVSADGAARAVQSLPARFDAATVDVEQFFATSKDGTRVPYFVARKKGAAAPAAALIHAYGGFRAAQTPTYLTSEPYRAGPLAKWWVEDGQVHVIANIRGGGEYGPAWHEDALREKRQNAYDDLYAVAEDLVARGLSTKGRIAVSGRSNGGLMAGVAVTQRPDLFGAAIIGSPLLDMKRYNKLLAGASWTAEYGNPDVAEDWAFISRYSPYQAVKPGIQYPPVFFYSSTEDDRVHPGHARKMAARLMEYGQPVYFHEYREGGHSVGADHAEDAVRAALLHAYLRRVLIEGDRSAP